MMGKFSDRFLINSPAISAAQNTHTQAVIFEIAKAIRTARVYTKDGGKRVYTGLHQRQGQAPSTGSFWVYTKDGVYTKDRSKPLLRAVFPTGF